MNESNSSVFTELDDDGLDIEAIFGSSSAGSENPFEAPESTQEITEEKQKAPAEQQTTETPLPAPEKKTEKAEPEKKEIPAPISATFENKTQENTQKGLYDKLPIFYHKGAKETIEDTSMTFEELRIRKSEDFTDLEAGKYVTWSVEYGTIRKDVKDPEGTTIASMKESIERSREFLEMLRKSKDKNPDCLVKPRVTMKSKGVAAYRGVFGSAEEARQSDKVICLFPANDGKFYEMRKTEQGEFIAPKNKVTEFQSARAGFTPALPLIPMSLIGQIIAFFRSFMREHEEYEALALIYWDKLEQEYFAYVPKQTVQKSHLDADLSDCPYDDESRFIRYADIHSHNSMEAFFSAEDDWDESETGLYLVLGELDHFFPEIKARIFCGGSFVPIDPGTVIEGLEREYPKDWHTHVTCIKREPRLPARRKAVFEDLDDEVSY